MILRKFFRSLLLLLFFKITFQENEISTPNQDTSNQSTMNQDTANQNAPNTNNTNQNTTNQNSTNENTTNQDTTNQTTTSEATQNPSIPNPKNTLQKETCDFEKYSYYTQITGESVSGRRLCGGSIITRKIVLTSAQCCNGLTKNTVIIYFGYNANDYKLKRKVTKIELHPNFATLDPRRADMTSHDACLLTIDTPVDINEQFQAVEIGTSDTMVELFKNTDATVEIVGYGFKFSPDSTPHNENPVIFHCEKLSIMQSTECGFTKPQCDGKLIFCTGTNHVYMGSPVVYKCKLVGLMSFDGKEIMYHSRIDTIRKWLEMKGLSGSNLISVELGNYVVLFAVLIRFLI